MVQYAPRFWGGIYSVAGQLQASIGSGLGQVSAGSKMPSATLSMKPSLIASSPFIPFTPTSSRELYRDHSERPFRFITVVTDSITVNSAWFRSPSDLYCVPNEATAGVLKTAGVPEARIKPLGFPVSHLFTEAAGPIPVTAAGLRANRAASFTSSTPGKKRRAKSSNAFWKFPTRTSPSPSAATPN